MVGKRGDAAQHRDHLQVRTVSGRSKVVPAFVAQVVRKLRCIQEWLGYLLRRIHGFAIHVGGQDFSGENLLGIAVQ